MGLNADDGDGDPGNGRAYAQIPHEYDHGDGVRKPAFRDHGDDGDRCVREYGRAGVADAGGGEHAFLERSK